MWSLSNCLPHCSILTVMICSFSEPPHPHPPRCFVFLPASFFNRTSSPHSTIHCMNHTHPLTAPCRAHGFLVWGHRYLFYISVFAYLWIPSPSKDMSTVFTSAHSFSAVSVAFMVGVVVAAAAVGGGGFLLPISYRSIRRRCSPVSHAFSDPPIGLLRASSQQSMCCFCFIFRHSVALALRNRGAFTLAIMKRGLTRQAFACSTSVI